MEQSMTQAELIIFLETLAENVELKAGSGQEAAQIIRDKIEQLKEKMGPSHPKQREPKNDRGLSPGRSYCTMFLWKKQQ